MQVEIDRSVNVTVSINLNRVTTQETVFEIGHIEVVFLLVSTELRGLHRLAQLSDCCHVFSLPQINYRISTLLA